MPARLARNSTAPTKSRCSISRTNEMTSPPALQPKHFQSPSPSFTPNEGVFSAWNGHRPTQRTPTRRSGTYCWTISTSGTAARTRSMSSSTIPTRWRLPARSFGGAHLFSARPPQRHDDRHGQHGGDESQRERRRDVVPVRRDHLEADVREDDRQTLLQVDEPLPDVGQQEVQRS